MLIVRSLIKAEEICFVFVYFQSISSIMQVSALYTLQTAFYVTDISPSIHIPITDGNVMIGTCKYISLLRLLFGKTAPLLQLLID